MPLPLPISPADALAQIIDPALSLLPYSLTSERAELLMLTIALQEAGKDGMLAYRLQQGGPARGLWQFERGGGVAGVLGCSATAELAKRLCALRGVPALSSSVYDALGHDDVLAAGFARLLLLSDPAPLPEPNDTEGAWRCYLRNWRPGAYARGSETQRKVLEAKFYRQHAIAIAAVREGPLA
jgi:hypothetical protein